MNNIFLISVYGISLTFITLGFLGILVYVIGLLVNKYYSKKELAAIKGVIQEKKYKEKHNLYSDTDLTKVASIAALLFLLEEEKRTISIKPSNKLIIYKWRIDNSEFSRKPFWR